MKNPIKALSALLVFLCAGTPALAQHAQVSSVRVDPADSTRVWVCNRDNNSVSVVDTVSGTVVHEIRVGVRPRSIAFSADGTRAFVACQRGGIPLRKNFVTPFDPGDIRAAVAVIDTASKTLSTLLTDVGVEPYGVAVAPNGNYLAVSGFRSGTIKLFDPVTLVPLGTFEYLHDVNFIPDPFDITDVDSNRDDQADLKDPRGFVIRDTSDRIWVTHNKSPYVSVLDVELDRSGVPTGNITLAAKIDTNDYALHPIYNPVPVQTIESQGVPRFLEDIALSPDGGKALVPHLLHNVNHDVNFDFTSVFAPFPGDFANRVYPALTEIDAAGSTFDAGKRLHHQLYDTMAPAEHVPFGSGSERANGMLTLGAVGEPVLGGLVSFRVTGLQAGDTADLLLGTVETAQPQANGVKYVVERRTIAMTVAGGEASFDWPVPTQASLEGLVVLGQVRVTNGGSAYWSTGLRTILQTEGYGVGKMGRRAGHPSRVLYNASGSHVLMLNRGSEDLFLYRSNRPSPLGPITGSSLELVDVHPPRHGFVERGPFDVTRAIGDVPMGMTLVEDPSTTADDALVYVLNEGSTSLSVLRVNFDTETIHKVRNQIKTITGIDILSESERVGFELFEDASRGQTTGAHGMVGGFNNSCASCHFEGGDDGNVWQRPAGPRSTMPVYGGSLGTGLILWKGVRINMGETGPMFGGENGGHGVLTDAEQDGLNAYHEIIPVPLNPRLQSDSSYAPGTPGEDAAFGRDLFFGFNDTGLNGGLRVAGCAECHPDVETNPLNFPGPRFYTADFLNPDLRGGDNLPTMDPDCFTLRENIALGNSNFVNVNTGVNTVINCDQNTPEPETDRNCDGYDDMETYAPMNADADDPFARDDGNSYLCPCTPGTFGCGDDGFRIFSRSPDVFSIPTKLGVFSTPPYFHDHSVYSLRILLDPAALHRPGSKYGSDAWMAIGEPAYHGVNKVFNDVHDVRGHEQFVTGVSKVQQSLQSGSDAQASIDTEALLLYISSL